MPKRVDHEERRRQIADALLRTAAARGLHATGMREVAAEAGVSLRLVQYYFGTKEELLLAGMQHLAARFGERAMTRIRRIKETNARAGPRDVIAAIQTEALPADDERRTFAVLNAAYFALALTDPALAIGPLVRNSTAVIDVIAAQLRAAQAAGDAPADLDPDAEAISLLAMSHGLGTSVLGGQSSVEQAQAVIDYHLDRLFPASRPALRCRRPGSYLRLVVEPHTFGGPSGLLLTVRWSSASMPLVGWRDPVVCIVGAGPAGLVTAHLLQRAQISFVVLERQEADGLCARVKAGLIEHRTVELLGPHGLAEPIVRRGGRVGTIEFRAGGQALMLDYARLCGGRGSYTCPQHELVAVWAGQLQAAGGDLRFGLEATGVEQSDDGAVVRAVRGPAGEPVSIECEAVVVSDGAGSVLSSGAAAVSAVYPARWLTLIAAAPPSTPGAIYGLHARGFAGQFHRSAAMTRFMLEIPAGEGYGQWDDDRIWAELEQRLAAAGRPAIGRGEFIERDILDHRVRVCDPMQHGRVYLAGDAAHLITPAGGKGMNMAIQDAVELAAGLAGRYGEYRDGRRLDSYTGTRLPQVWRHQEFSNLMLSLFNAGTADGGPDFAYGLRRARLDLIVSDPQFSRWFARAYAGVDD